MTAPVPHHHAERQSKRQDCVGQSSDGCTHRHVEPDPGPLGLHPAEEGSPEEDLHVAQQMLGSQISSSSPLATKLPPQLDGDQQLSARPARLSLSC